MLVKNYFNFRLTVFIDFTYIKIYVEEGIE